MKYGTKRIEEICIRVTSGGTPKSTNNAFYNPKEIPWLKTSEVNYNRIYDTETYISKEGLRRSSAKLIPENSVVVAMYGQGDTAGRVAINKIPLCTNQACCNLIIDYNMADYEYVYYALSTLYPQLVLLKNGGAQPNLNASIVKSVEIPFPELKTQHRIAKVLSAYDNLIENNQKQIKLLEEVAQRLYKEWFVDLHFPGYEDTKIVDGVPEGWHRGTIKDAALLIRRGISPKYDEKGKYLVINQKCIRSSIMDLSEARRQIKDYPVELGLLDSDTVICSTGTGTLGRVGQVFGDYPLTTFDSHITAVRANSDIGKQFLYSSIKKNQDFLMGMGRGSTNQQELYRNVIESISILIPVASFITPFENIAQAIHDKISILSKDIVLLQQARDRLLPKLMSGELEV